MKWLFFIIFLFDNNNNNNFATKQRKKNYNKEPRAWTTSVPLVIRNRVQKKTAAKHFYFVLVLYEQLASSPFAFRIVDCRRPDIGSDKLFSPKNEKKKNISQSISISSKVNQMHVKNLLRWWWWWWCNCFDDWRKLKQNWEKRKSN